MYNISCCLSLKDLMLLDTFSPFIISTKLVQHCSWPSPPLQNPACTYPHCNLSGIWVRFECLLLTDIACVLQGQGEMRWALQRSDTHTSLHVQTDEIVIFKLLLFRPTRWFKAHHLRQFVSVKTDFVGWIFWIFQPFKCILCRYVFYNKVAILKYEHVK